MQKREECPCRGCAERAVGCHSGCEKYIGWMKIEREWKAAIRSKQEKDSLWLDTHRKNKEATKKKYQKH